MLRYLSLDSFPRATLSENCSLLGTDNIKGQISGIFPRQIEAIVYISSMFITVIISMSSDILRSQRNSCLAGY